MYELNLIQDQINYLYAACFSPPQSTFLHAIRQGFFVTFPNLTAKLVSKYLIKSVASAKGHLDQQYKNFDQQHQLPSIIIHMIVHYMRTSSQTLPQSAQI